MRSRSFLVACIGVVAVVCAYFAGRMQESRSSENSTATPSIEQRAEQPSKTAAERAAPAAERLPPPNTPLKRSFARLQDRADAGDLAAATRLYRDVNRCHLFASLDFGTGKFVDEILAQKTDGMDAEQLAGYRSQLEAAESNKRNMDRFHTLCDGADDAMLQSLVPNLRRAAEMGEPYARACYLAQGPNVDPQGLLEHPGWLNAYRASAPVMMQQGIKAGDWRVVRLLRNAAAPGAQSLLTAAVGESPAQYYRYLKLLRLGTTSDAALDRDLAAIATKLTPAEIADAESWAQTTFDGEFDGKPVDADGPAWDPCIFPDDGQGEE